MWHSLGLGLTHNMLVFNSMCLSVLGFIAQLVEAPDAVIQRINYWQQKFARGPWNWICFADLQNLKGVGFA